MPTSCHAPRKDSHYLKWVVKEKWDEVNRLRKRRVRWTIGGDKIDVEYEVGTNTAILPTVKEESEMDDRGRQDRRRV